MPSGYPDYFGQPSFPTIGSALEYEDDDHIDGPGSKDIFVAAGPRVSYGGYFWTEDPDFYTNCFLTIYIDGSKFISVNPSDFKTRDIFQSVSLPVYLTYVDPDASEYCFSIRPDITFQSSFALRISCIAAVEVEYHFFFYYGAPS